MSVLDSRTVLVRSLAPNVLLMSQCGYLYTDDGIRLPEDKIMLKIEIDGITRMLRLVRPGKGRSRIDRWENSPQGRYGVTGEINTRDLAAWREDGRITSWFPYYTPDWLDYGILIDLDLDRIMGREGRGQDPNKIIEHIRRMHAVDNSLPLAKNWVADAVLRYAPYGKENSADYRDVIDALLPDADGAWGGIILAETDLAEKIKGGAINFMIHCSDKKLEYIMRTQILRDAVEQALKSVSGDHGDLVSRVDLTSKIIKARQYLRNNGRDMSRLMSIHSFSVSELSRLTDGAPMEVFEIMADTSSQESVKCIKEGQVDGGSAALLASALLQRGVELDRDTLALVAGVLYNGSSYHSAISSAMSGLSLDEYQDKTTDITRRIVEPTMRDYPGVIYGLGIIDKGGPSHAAREAVVRISSEILARGPADADDEIGRDLLTYAAEVVLRGRIDIEYGDLPDVHGEDRLEDIRSDAAPVSSLVRAVREISEHHAERVVTSVSTSSNAGLLSRESTGFGMKELVILAAALPETARDGYEFVLGRDQDDEHINYALGMFYAVSKPAMVREWVDDVLPKIMREGDGAATDFAFRTQRNDPRATRASVVAAAVRSDNSGYVEGRILEETEQFSGSAAKKSTGVVLERDKQSSWRSPIQSSGDGTNSVSDMRFMSAEDLRIGVALGTSNLDTLRKMLEDEREHAAGPVAAMRLIGHPDFPGLDVQVPADLLEMARDRVRATSMKDAKRGTRESILLIFRAAAMARSLSR